MHDLSIPPRDLETALRDHVKARREIGIPPSFAAIRIAHDLDMELMDRARGYAVKTMRLSDVQIRQVLHTDAGHTLFGRVPL